MAQVARRAGAAARAAVAAWAGKAASTERCARLPSTLLVALGLEVRAHVGVSFSVEVAHEKRAEAVAACRLKVEDPSTLGRPEAGDWGPRQSSMMLMLRSGDVGAA